VAGSLVNDGIAVLGVLAGTLVVDRIGRRGGAAIGTLLLPLGPETYGLTLTQRYAAASRPLHKGCHCRHHGLTCQGAVARDAAGAADARQGRA
jgi:hypothetical protein